MSKSPNLIWLRSFERAARHLSFTAAAAELGLTQTAVSLHVRSLESQLGCALFTRAARNLRLTEVGQAYAFSVRRALGEIDLSTTSLFGAGRQQQLTVRAPISTASLFLAHRLPAFAEVYPPVSVRLVSNIWAESAGRENVDVELRLGLGDWGDAPVRKISEERIVPIVASALASAPARRRWSIAELMRLPPVQILGFQNLWQRYLAAQGLERADMPAGHAVDTTIAAVDIVAAGGGYAVVLERFARTAIAAGRAIAVVGDPVPIDQSHYLVGGRDRRESAGAVQLFERWVEQQFADDC